MSLLPGDGEFYQFTNGGFIVLQGDGNVVVNNFEAEPLRYVLLFLMHLLNRN